jgi:uncharacterized OB-fold protein
VESDPPVPLDHFPEAAPRPAPVVHPETEPFWAGLAEGELRVQVCAACGTHRFPFAPVCFACLSFEHTWEAISPQGRLAVAAVVHRATGDRAWAAHVPFASGLVELEHGLRLPGRILCTCGELARGAPVRAVVLGAPGEPPVHGLAHTCVAAPP